MSGAGLETLTLGPWLATARGAEAAGHALSSDRPLVLASLETERAGTGRAAGCAGLRSCAAGGRRTPRGPAAARAAAGAGAGCGSGRHDRRRDGHRARPRAHGRRTGAPPRRPGSDGDVCARRCIDAHADARARDDVSGRRATHGGRCRGAVAPRSAREGAGPGGDIGPAARDREAVNPDCGSERAAGRLAAPRAPGAGHRRRHRRAGHQCRPGRSACAVDAARLRVLAVHGVRLEPGGEVALLDRAAEIGRQLSAILENVQLLDDVLRSRAELENVFNSLTDLVAVTDSAGRIVEANRAFAARVGQPREALIDQRDSTTCSRPRWPSGSSANATRPRQPCRTRRELVDQRLGGTFDLTLTPLAGLDPAPGGHGARRARRHGRVAARGRARLARTAARTIREAAGAWPVRGRRRTRVEQPAARRARAPRAAARLTDAAGVAAARPRAGLPRSRPRRAHRPQPARLRGLGTSAPSARGHQRRRRARAAAAVEGAQGRQHRGAARSRRRAAKGEGRRTAAAAGVAQSDAERRAGNGGPGPTGCLAPR